MHRAHVSATDASGRRLASPVTYSGSTERTSFAERNERKGNCLFDLRPTSCGTGRVRRLRFMPPPSRPMLDIVLDAADPSEEAVVSAFGRAISALDPDSVVRMTVKGPAAGTAGRILRAGLLRSLVPRTMNLHLREV